MTENTMAKKRIKRQRIIWKVQHRKPKFEQQEPTKIRGRSQALPQDNDAFVHNTLVVYIPGKKREDICNLSHIRYL